MTDKMEDNFVTVKNTHVTVLHYNGTGPYKPGEEFDVDKRNALVQHWLTHGAVELVEKKKASKKKKKKEEEPKEEPEEVKDEMAEPTEEIIGDE